MKLVVGITGASGAIYAARMVGFLREHGPGIETHLVFTKMGRVVWNEEIGTDPADLGFPVWAHGDMTAPFASGSARFDAMVVMPCSAGSLARIAHGLSTDLVGRAADVMLKERRKLVLVVRESPYHLVMLRNMVAATEAGALVMPASPSFYSGPKDMGQLVDTVVARVLDHLGVDNALMERWTGLKGNR
jgi:4-hydroxy-3-polyprenylbenzoate decarboxylase